LIIKKIIILFFTEAPIIFQQINYFFSNKSFFLSIKVKAYFLWEEELKPKSNKEITKKQFKI